jgi:hypothetical protein
MKATEFNKHNTRYNNGMTADVTQCIQQIDPQPHEKRVNVKYLVIERPYVDRLIVRYIPSLPASPLYDDEKLPLWIRF